MREWMETGWHAPFPLFPLRDVPLSIYQQLHYTSSYFPFFSWSIVELQCCVAAAAAAKSLQSCPTLCDPIDGSPPGSTVPGILQARTLEWAAISFSSAWKWKVKGKSLSCVRLFATSWAAAYQVPPSMGFCRREYWSRVPSPSPTVLCWFLLYSKMVQLCIYIYMYIYICSFSYSFPLWFITGYWT